MEGYRFSVLWKIWQVYVNLSNLSESAPDVNVRTRGADEACGADEHVL
jgi:hypothetical protein